MAHQWFGNLVTETEGKHHWFHEGLPPTMHYWLSVRFLYGLLLLETLSKCRAVKGFKWRRKGEYLLDPKASSLTFYEKGAWAPIFWKKPLVRIRLRMQWKNYLKKRLPKCKYRRFLNEIRALTNTDISSWEQDWLYQSAFQSEAATNRWCNHPSFKKYFETAACGTFLYQTKKRSFEKQYRRQWVYWTRSGIPIVQRALSEVMSLYQTAMKTENIWFAVALSMDGIPESFRAEYENLLNDASYLTQEGFVQSVVAVSGRRTVYLDRMDGIMGFQDKTFGNCS